MTISTSRSYIAMNPQFELTRPDSDPKLQKGEMTIVYECFKRFGPRLSLKELVGHCDKPEYRDRFTNPKTDITKSVLYHLKLLVEDPINRVKNAQRPVIREVLK